MKGKKQVKARVRAPTKKPQTIGSCDNPKHKTVTDLIAREVICIDCGGVVLQDQSDALKLNLSSIDERELTTIQHMPEQKGKIIQIGTDLAYRSKSEPGQIFRDSNPFRVKDFEGHRCLPLIASNNGIAYQHAKSFQRNGYWDESGLKFIAAYDRDAWYADASTIRHQLCGEYRINDTMEPRLASKDLKGYSSIILGIMPELISRLNIHMIPGGHLLQQHRDANRKFAVELLESLGSILSKMLDKGDRIADLEDGYDVLEDPYEEITTKKRKVMSIAEGDQVQVLDDGLDMGKI